MKNVGTAYLMWCFWLFGFAGIHRFYLGKPLSGLVWFFTWGMFGIGQLIDLALIPEMVEEKNLRYRLLTGKSPQEQIAPTLVIPQQQPSDLHSILKLMQVKGEATLADCVIATGKDPQTVRALLEKMQREELIEIGNRDWDGAIVYRII